MRKTKVDRAMSVTVLLVIASVASVVEGAWTRKADMPTARFGLTANVVDNKIYAIGGASKAQVGALAVEEYDPATNRWTKKADMPTVARCFYSASTVDGKIYAFGGLLNGQNWIVEQYDPATDTWRRMADMPTARWGLATGVVNGKIYAVGGCPEAGTAFLRTVEEYDPATDTWTRKADMSTPRGVFSVSVVDGTLYAIGGSRSHGGSAISTVEAYDPVTDAWTSKSSMPSPRDFHSSAVVDGKIFVIGGCLDPYSSAPLSRMEIYDPTTDSWTTMADVPTARKFLATCAVDGKIYAIGGSAETAFNTSITTLEVYDLTPPPPDFNGDGLVGMTDLLRVVESWGQDDPLADIAPPPFGDGVVDVLDLELLMSYWKEPVDDPTLIAHWSLDEADGVIASDSKVASDGYVFGDPVWIPDGGQMGGAISLDGIDDHIVTSLALNPAEGPFSVFAWVQGGAPGQAVISQFNGANWLSADPASGCLMTELRAFGRGGVPLLSTVNITDGLWHRIGFVWDGVYRVIYVDDVPVAEDTQNGLESSIGGLKIGGGTDSAAGTFWSGMIDDVRIYNRAVHP